jgi:CheY-like chemotaxis protein
MKSARPVLLLIDDDENDLLLVQRAFRDIGMTDRIETVRSGTQAIEYLKALPPYSDRKTFPYPTFIMVDLKMPALDGFAVLHHLKQNPRWAIIPTIVFTASFDSDDIKTAYRLGASAYHIKPTSNEALRSQLRVLHEYWKTCEVPDVDGDGCQTQTNRTGRLGERFLLD